MSGLGPQLRAARERLKATASQVAAATHLKVLVIEAMERDDYGKLIAPAYAKGFYKLYCDYLGLDAEPFIESYLNSPGVSEDKTELIRDQKKKAGLFSGLQKKMQEMQKRGKEKEPRKKTSPARPAQAGDGEPEIH